MENLKSIIEEKQSKKTLKDVLGELQEQVEITLKYFEVIDKTNLPLLLGAFKLLRENRDILNKIAEVLDGQYRIMAESVLPEIFKSMEFDSVKMHGRNFILSNRTHWSLKGDNRPEGLKWLRENNLGMLIKEDVNSKTLSSALNELLENEAKAPPQNVVNMHSVDVISIRKA